MLVPEEIRDPTPGQLRVFAGLWLLFFGGIAALAWWRPEGLVAAAVVLGAALLVSLALNPVSRRIQSLGAIGPIVFGVAGLAPRAGVPRVGVAIALALVGVVGALAIVVAPALGSRIYRGWMLSALPMSWTVSRLALGVVYYVVLTPIGLLLRATGYDPLALRSDPTATSNWIKRDRPRDPDRYFRQF